MGTEEPLELCDHCGRGVKSTKAVRVTKRSIGEKVPLHPACADAIKKSRGENRELRRLRIEVGLRDVPEVPWTDPDDPELAQRLHPSFLRFAQRYEPREHRSALLLGPSAAGKTLSVSVALRRLAAKAEGSDSASDWFARVRWVSGHKLVKAAKEWPLGAGECLLVSRCRKASLLVIDEVGFEPLNEVLLDVIDHRYSQRAPTVVTTGLTVEDFKARYGDAMRRRLSGRDAGRSVDSHK